MSNQSFNELFLAQRSSLLGKLRRMVNNHAIAEELTQEAYVRVSRALNSGSQIANLQGFLFQTARNLVLDHLRSQKRQSAILVGSLDEHEESDAMAVPGPGDIVADQQQVAQLTDLLKNLSERQRKSFILSRMHGWSHARIATELGVSESTVQKDIQLVMKLCISKLRS